MNQPILVYLANMGYLGSASDQLRQRIKAERLRRRMSQTELAAALTKRGITAYGTTIAKIESGFRDTRTDELAAFADIFGVSTDMLIGHGRGSTDLAWAVSKLTATAQKAARDVQAMNQGVCDDMADVRTAVTIGGESVDNVLEIAGTVLLRLAEAQAWLAHLAAQFPIPTNEIAPPVDATGGAKIAAG